MDSVCQSASVNNPYWGLSTLHPNTAEAKEITLPVSRFFRYCSPSQPLLFEDNRVQERPSAENEEDAHHSSSSWFIPNLGLQVITLQKHQHETEVDIHGPHLDLEYAGNSSASHQMDSIVPPLPFPSSHASNIPNNPYSNRSVSSSEAGVAPDGSQDVSNTYIFPPSYAVATPAVGPDREEKVMRYREKRKSRRFEKTIRYASRKAYAETRPRVKGRFAAKRVDTDDADVETASSYFLQYPSPLLLVEVDEGFGAAPSSSI